MSIISAKNISLKYDKKQILTNINWEIELGSITTLVGPNGCGKSTLLRLLTGHLKIQMGQIKLFDRPINSYSVTEIAKKIAFLPQQQELPKDMTVREIITCGRFPYQKWWQNNTESDEKIVNEIMDIVQVYDLANQNVGSLSGGECQRVAIAMALAQEPSILVLDEPTTYLDIQYQLEILELLKKLNQDNEITIIMVLHDLNQAAKYSDTVAILKNGELIEIGTPKKVFTEKYIENVFSVNAEIIVENEIPYIKVKSLH